jgi:hypothetical protein
MGSPQGCCKRKQLCSSYGAGPKCGAAGEDAGLLCAASPLSSRRVRDLEYIAPVQKAAWSHKTFANGTWGGKIALEH